MRRPSAKSPPRLLRQSTGLLLAHWSAILAWLPNRLVISCCTCARAEANFVIATAWVVALRVVDLLLNFIPVIILVGTPRWVLDVN